MILAWLMAAAAPATAAAASPPVVKVGSVASAQACDTYSHWGYWFVTDCHDQFPGMRESLQSALLDSGRVRLSSSTGGRESAKPDMVVTASVSGLGMETSRASGDDYCIAATRVKGTVDYRVRSREGGTVYYGGSLTKSVEVAHHVVAGASGCRSQTPSQVDYRQLQQELALAVARAIIFKVEPLRVVSADADGVVLNYGAPFVTLGLAVDVEDERGVPIRFRVASAGTSRSLAKPVSGRRPIAPASLARLVERDSPADNARRLDRVELP